MLYPAYYSYKAVKTKNVKEYVSVCYLFIFSFELCLHFDWTVLRFNQVMQTFAQAQQFTVVSNSS